MANVELVVVSFPGEEKARAALKELKRQVQQKDLVLINAAVLQKGPDGRPHVSEIEDVNPSQGALFGAIAGGLIGLLGGPAGAVVGASAGAATGGLAARNIDLGFSKEFLDVLQGSLQPNSSALLALVDKEWVDRLLKVLGPHDGKLLRHAVKAEILQQLDHPSPGEPGAPRL